MKSPRATMSANCKAYQKPSCWLPRKPGTDLCATCCASRQRNEFRTFLSILPTQSEEDIYSFYTTHTDILSSPINSPLDTFLSAVHRKSPQLLERILRDIRTGPLNPTLLLRVRNHTRSSMCSVYSWILRKGLFTDMILPQRCLKCLAHTVWYGCDEKRRLVNRMIVFQVELPGLVRSTLQMLEGRDRVLDFQNALIERGFAQRTIHAYVTMCGQEVPTRHPLTFEWRPQTKQILQERIAPWKEELIAKSWHPCRMQHWCLDLTEQDLWKEDIIDFPAPPSLRGSRADWHIRWDRGYIYTVLDVVDAVVGPGAL